MVLDKSKHNQNIIHAKETNFLGVILDESLNWKSEITHVSIFPTDPIFKDLGILKCDDTGPVYVFWQKFILTSKV